MLGGSASARLQHTGIIFSYGFYPLALWLLEEALDRRSYRWGLGFAAVAALMTVGRDQVAFLCALSLAGLSSTASWHAGPARAFCSSASASSWSMALVGGALLASRPC